MKEMDLKKILIEFVFTQKKKFPIGNKINLNTIEINKNLYLQVIFRFLFC